MYCTYLLEQINSISITQCVGCMVNDTWNYGDAHNCKNTNYCVDQYFECAMVNIDETVLNKSLEENGIKNYPLKAELQKNEIWCNAVKNMLKVM